MPGGDSRLGYWQLMDLKRRVPTIFYLFLEQTASNPMPCQLFQCRNQTLL
jgi:hypothetical protein